MSVTGTGARTLVTTSWDDGHPDDLRTAGLLQQYGLTGTFYVTVRTSKRSKLIAPQIRELAAMGFEIGSHTLHHPILTHLDEKALFQELDGSKRELEDLLGRPVTSMCYPKGKFNRLVRKQSAKAGYTLARTTVAFRTSLEFDAMAMPVSCQFNRLSRTRSLRHVMREGNVGGFLDWCRLYRLESDPVKLASLIFDNVQRHGGVMHVWGHSWELRQENLWDALTELLQHVAGRPDVAYVNNRDVLNFRGIKDPSWTVSNA